MRTFPSYIKQELRAEIDARIGEKLVQTDNPMLPETVYYAVFNGGREFKHANFAEVAAQVEIAVRAEIDLKKRREAAAPRLIAMLQMYLNVDEQANQAILGKNGGYARHLLGAYRADVKKLLKEMEAS